MDELFELMKNHSSVRNFTEEKIPDSDIRKMIETGFAASNWKNFQSYSIIVVKSQEQKDAIYQYQPQKAIKNCSHYLVMVGDLKRAETAVKMHGKPFQPAGIESLLISSVDASLAAQNILLAAEAMDYGGVMVGLIRDQSEEISDVLNLPDYTYPLFGIAVGVPARTNPPKPRLPYEAVVFDEKYQIQDEVVIKAQDEVQTEYAGQRRIDSTWSERIAQQWGNPEISSSTDNLKKRKLL